MRDAPAVPARCVGVLVGLAWRADDDGRNSFPSEATLDNYSRKSVRQVRRDLVELLRLGLIRDGDPARAGRLRAGYRPRVYDLAVERNETGHPRPVSSVQGGHPRPVSDDRSGGGRADIHGHSDRTPTSANRSLIGPTTGHLGRAGGVSRTRERAPGGPPKGVYPKWTHPDLRARLRVLAWSLTPPRKVGGNASRNRRGQQKRRMRTGAVSPTILPSPRKWFPGLGKMLPT